MLSMITAVLSPAPFCPDAPVQRGRLWEQRHVPAVILPDSELLPSFPHLSFRTPRVARASAWGCPLQFIREADVVVLSHRIMVYTAPDFGKGRKDGLLGSSRHRPGCVLAKVLS